MAAGLTLAVAEMVPTPPFRILARRNDSLPTKTSKPSELSTASLDRTGSYEGVEKHLGVVPIARAIFHSGDCIRISRKEALDQSRGDANHRHRRNVVEINFQSRITDALHNFAEIAVETFFADILVIKRRQHQHARATVLRPPVR